jgi:hypothetical protein
LLAAASPTAALGSSVWETSSQAFQESNAFADLGNPARPAANREPLFFIVGGWCMLRSLTRIPGVRRLWRRIPLGSVPLRTQFDIWERPAYAYGIYSAAKLARSLEFETLRVIEFGVAGGNGLLAMERLADKIGSDVGVKIAVHGFDTGTGMPPPRDHRDLPHVWGQGFYQMEPAKLQAELRSAQLLLGDVIETIPTFLAEGSSGPIGFVAFDLDYYSSTKSAFRIFGGVPETRLPRVYCYFDDVVWPEQACHNDYVGELCAIREFNEEHDRQKIAKIPNLSWMRPHPARWNEQMYVFHDFEHPLYTRLLTPPGDANRQKRLT